MPKKTKEKNQRSKTSWLKLTLELLVVSIGVSAGFLFDNYREERSNRKLEEKYLESFYNNMIADSAEIKTMMQNERNNIDISGQTVTAMQEGTLTNDSAVAIFSVMATYNNLNLEDAT